MKFSRFAPFVAVIFSTFLGTGYAAAAERERPLNSQWSFLRGDAAGAEQPQFNDAGWRHVDLPHDWSIEDLPPRDADPLYAVITATPGAWKFSPGDDASWADADFDDSNWRTVNLPESWDKHRHPGEAEGVGWYRRHFTVPDSADDKTVLLELGVINGHDWIYVDGLKDEETGDDYWSNGSITARTFELTSTQGEPGDHVIAVKIKGPPKGASPPPSRRPPDCRLSIRDGARGTSAPATRWAALVGIDNVLRCRRRMTGNWRGWCSMAVTWRRRFG